MSDAADEGRSLGELVASAAADLHELVHDEIALAKAEVRQDIQRAKLGGAVGAVAAVLALLALPLLAIALAFWIRAWWGAPPAIAFLVTAGVFLVLAGIFAAVAVAKFKRITPPERSIRSAKESASVLSGVRPHPRAESDGKAGTPV
ncbi:phage holin family protein [Streptomyces carpaticus]|uniref:Phage holin family protein n=1 Tax=Streptomyces carpaticus TaxID=285558 RepID=A0ABV4ZIF2_9ACTN